MGIGRRGGELARAFGVNVLALDVFLGANPGFASFAWVGLETVFSAEAMGPMGAAWENNPASFADKFHAI